MSERPNRNLSVRNTLVQLLALYTDPESHNAQRYRWMDGQTDDMMIPIVEEITTSQTLSTFRQQLKTWLFRKSYPEIII